MFAARAVTSLRCLSKPSLVRQLPQLSFATSSVRASSGDHVKMWSAERVVSVAQVPAFILPFIVTAHMMDAMFCTGAWKPSWWTTSDPASSMAARSSLILLWGKTQSDRSVIRSSSYLQLGVGPLSRHPGSSLVL